MNTPDATSHVIAVRIANRVLHVADERVVPVGQIQRPVGTKLNIDGPKARIARREQRIDRIGGKARTFVLYLVLQHALKSDAVVEQIVALGLRREVAAADQLAAAGRPPL